MTILIIGLILFLGTHSISMISVGWRDKMAAKIGEKAFQGIHSLIALIGFILIIWGYGLATPIHLYTPNPWLVHIAWLLMLPVFPIFFAAYLPGRIQSTVKHPMLAAVKIWAFAHLISNGMLADVVLFGAFLIWAVADRISLKYRVAKPVSGAPPSKFNDLIAIVLGLLLYVVFIFWLHGWLFGMPLKS